MSQMRSAHPWVAGVIRVQKAFPAAITVELQYRQPVAMIQVPGGRIPVDLEAVVLPTADFSPADLELYPLIQNVVPNPVVRPGTAWKDPALMAAVKLAGLLRDQWKPLKLTAISIPRNVSSSAAANDVSLELVTQGGSRILWGRPPGSDHPGELQATQKIKRLENYLAQFGDYGRPNGPYEIDIRHWRENSRRPLVTEQQPSKPTKMLKAEPRIQSSEARRKTRG